jgi:outer membrane protein assembly factor BamB
MKKILFLLAVLTIFVGTACDGDGNIFKKSPKKLWETPIAERKSGISSGLIYGTVTHNNNILVEAEKSSKSYLYALNATTGAKVWEWTEFHNKFRHTVPRNPYIIQGKLITEDYCLNLDNGTTIWKRVTSGFGPHVGYDNTYITFNKSTDSINIYETSLYIGDINNPNNLTEIRMPYTREYPIDNIYNRSIQGVKMFLRGTDRMLAVGYQETGNHSGVHKGTIPKFGLYNLTQGSWEFSNKWVEQDYKSSTLIQSMQIFEDKVFFSVGNLIICHSLVTGKQLWKRAFNDSFWYSGINIFDGKLVGRGVGQILVCLDITSGNTLWQISRGGIGSDLVYHNGVIYYTRQNLEAVDINTGKVLAEIAPPKDGSSTDSFDSIVRIVPSSTGGKATIVVNTYKYAYGYEAVR